MSEANEPINNLGRSSSLDDINSTPPPPERENTNVLHAVQPQPTSGTPFFQQQQHQQPSTPPPPPAITLSLASTTASVNAAAPAPSGRIKQPNYTIGEQTHSTIAELSEAFRMFTNVNGIVPQSIISQKDLVAVMQQTGLRPTDKEVATLLQVLDQNQGGSISFDEFASLMGRSVPIEEVDSLQAAFQSIDRHGTGVVSSAAFAELMANHGENSNPEEVSEMLAFADPNNTGKVNYRVFLRMLGLRLR